MRFKIRIIAFDFSHFKKDLTYEHQTGFLALQDI